MELNANFDERAAVHAEKIEWKASPMPGVDRRMLERIGDEVARATTIVRYAPNSQFSSHVHTGGEEFFVLEGIFQDEHGDFPPGSYIRNPPGTSHTPGSEAGCTIFVKLWQFDPDDLTQVRLDTNNMEFSADPARKGVEVMLLFEDGNERVTLESWPAGATVKLEAVNGLELLVLDGDFMEGDEQFKHHSWLRLPNNGSSTATAGTSGTRVWIKRGHLATTPQAPAV